MPILMEVSHMYIELNDTVNTYRTTKRHELLTTASFEPSILVEPTEDLIEVQDHKRTSRDQVLKNELKTFATCETKTTLRNSILKSHYQNRIVESLKVESFICSTNC